MLYPYHVLGADKETKFDITIKRFLNLVLYSITFILMANKLDNLKPFKPIGEKALSHRALSVKVTPELDRAVRSLPDRSAWLRRVIEAAARAEGIYQEKDG